MRHYIFSLLICFGIAHQSLSQTVKNVQARADKYSVVITYDLVASAEGQKFNIQLKSSHDNFANVLKDVSGDVGPDQSAGLAKTIIWDAMKEIGNFSGSISFEVVATVSFTPLQFTNPTNATSAKIGKALDVRWEGGEQGRDLKMSLLKSNQQLMDIGSVGSNGSYSWNVPKSVDKGEKYQLRLFDPTKPNDAAMSAEFRLKKTSVLVYIIPAVVAVGVGAAILFGGGGGDTDCTDVCDSSCSNFNPSECQSTTTELASPPTPPGGGN